VEKKTGYPKISRRYVEENYEAVSKVHNKIIEVSGGEKGIRDKGGLYNSVYNILKCMERYGYKDPASIGAFVYEELAKRHHFNDGNKRTAHAFAKIVLMLMDYHLKIDYTKAVPFIIEIAKFNSKMTLEDIKKWIKPNLVKIPRPDIEKYLKDVLLDIRDGSQA